MTPAPHSLGVDYQQTFTHVELREGSLRDFRLRSVGDGRRTSIPNAICAHAWASDALRCACVAERGQGDPTASGPWLEGSGPIRFWSGLKNRLSTYLGRMVPNRRNRFEVIVAVPACESFVLHRMQERVSEAGLPEARCILATDALLCHWLAEGPWQVEGEKVVSVVVAGDTDTIVGAYRVRFGSSGQVVGVTQRQMAAIPSGHTHWARCLLTHVERRFSATESLPADWRLSLQDAVLPLVRRLGAGDPDGRDPSFHLPWEGPFREHMYSEVLVSPSDCRAWKDVVGLHKMLPLRVSETAARVSGEAGSPQGGKRGADILLLGGTGAAWPFPTDILQGMAPIFWKASHPERAVARGATCWSRFGDRWDRDLSAALPSPSPRAHGESLALPPPSPGLGPLLAPPAARRLFDPEALPPPEESVRPSWM